jgi:hypothetical protein
MPTSLSKAASEAERRKIDLTYSVVREELCRRRF